MNQGVLGRFRVVFVYRCLELGSPLRELLTCALLELNYLYLGLFWAAVGSSYYSYLLQNFFVGANVTALSLNQEHLHLVVIELVLPLHIIDLVLNSFNLMTFERIVAIDIYHFCICVFGRT